MQIQYQESVEMDQHPEYKTGGNRRKQMREKIKLINQGAYGCIYKPGIGCNGKPSVSTHFVTKLQKETPTSGNEIVLGSKITQIPNYSYHFAPVVSTCPVQLSSINSEYLRQCEVAQKDQKNASKSVYMLNRIRYAGTDTLETYISVRTKSTHFLPKFYEMHIYLLVSLQKLASANIVHFDLKENNIIYNPKIHVPIIIDFGLSIGIDSITNIPSNMSKTNISALYQRAFYVYYEKYPPWCLDIVLCSFIVQQHKQPKADGTNITNADSSRWMTAKVDIDKMLQIIEQFFTKNTIIQSIAEFNSSIVSKSKASWRQYIKEICIGKNGRQVVDTLIKSWKSWDNYGLAGIFMFIWMRYKLADFPSQISTEYQNMLIWIVLSIPTTRPDANSSTQELMSIVKRL
jgi:serine/threonine protein kinase